MDQKWENKKGTIGGEGWGAYFSETFNEPLVGRDGKEYRPRSMPVKIHVDTKRLFRLVLYRCFRSAVVSKGFQCAHAISTISLTVPEMWKQISHMQPIHIFGSKYIEASIINGKAPAASLAMLIEVCPTPRKDGADDEYLITQDCIKKAMVVRGDEVEDVKFDPEALGLAEFVLGSTQRVHPTMYGYHSLWMIVVSPHFAPTPVVWERLCAMCNAAAGVTVGRTAVPGAKMYDPSKIYVESSLANSDRIFVPETISNNFARMSEFSDLKEVVLPLMTVEPVLVPGKYRVVHMFTYYNADVTRSVLEYFKVAMEAMREQIKNCKVEVKHVRSMGNGLERYMVVNPKGVLGKDFLPARLVEYAIELDGGGGVLDIDLENIVHRDLPGTLERHLETARSELLQESKEYERRFAEAVERMISSIVGGRSTAAKKPV